MSSPRPFDKRKAAWRKGITLVLVGTVLLAATEGLLKKYYYGKTYRYYETGEIYWEDSNTLLLFNPDRYLFWSLKPNIEMKITENPEQYDLHTQGTTKGHYFFTVKTNSRGHNSPEVSISKPEKTIRIVTLGDSRTMAEGIAFDKLYSRRLECLLSTGGQNEKRRYEVINVGVSGYSSYQGLTQLKRTLLPYKPDVVTVLFGINDQDRDQGISDMEKGKRFNSLIMSFQSLANRSMTVYFLRHQATQIRGLLFGKTRVEPVRYRKDGEPSRRVSLEEYERNLRSIADLGEQHGFAPVFLIVPSSPYAFYPELFDPVPKGVPLEINKHVHYEASHDWKIEEGGLIRILAEHPDCSFARYLLAQCYQAMHRYGDAHREFVQMNQGIVFSRYEKTVRKVARERGIMLLDLTPEFTAITEEPLYVDDMHPSEYGHSIIARRLFEALTASSALKP